MSNKKHGFSLIEVIVSMVIFAVGFVFLAAFGAVNIMHLRVNQVRARLHILTESTTDDIQRWIKEPTPAPGGPTRFEDIWNDGDLGVLNPGDTLTTYTSRTITAVVLFDHVVGTTPSATDARIYVRIISDGFCGEKIIKDSLDFCLSNYGMGE